MIVPESRSANFDDLPVLQTMMREYYALDNLRFDPARAGRALELLIGSPHLGEARLVMVGHETAGYVVLTFGFSLECGGRDAFIDELFLKAPFRGRGIGTGVIRWAADHCRTLGIRALRLEVMRTNAAAHRLYGRIGFKEHDRHLLTLDLAPSGLRRDEP